MYGYFLEINYLLTYLLTRHYGVLNNTRADNLYYNKLNIIIIFNTLISTSYICYIIYMCSAGPVFQQWYLSVWSGSIAVLSVM